MKVIKLDPKKLLGFKIVADGSVARVSSPKIGVKGCAGVTDGASAVGAEGWVGEVQHVQN